MLHNLDAWMPLLEDVALGLGAVALVSSIISTIVGVTETQKRLSDQMSKAMDEAMAEITLKVDGKSEAFKITPKQAERLLTVLERRTKQEPQEHGVSRAVVAP